MPTPKGLTRQEVEQLKRLPPTDVVAFAQLVLDYLGTDSDADPLLDADTELRRRALAILAAFARPRPNKGWSAGQA